MKKTTVNKWNSEHLFVPVLYNGKKTSTTSPIWEKGGDLWVMIEMEKKPVRFYDLKLIKEKSEES